MNTLVNHLNAQVVEQDRHVALVDCFKTWDEELNLEVILQGIMDRYNAIGMQFVVKHGLKVIRPELNEVKILARYGSLITITRFRHLKKTDAAYQYHDDENVVGVYIARNENNEIFHDHEMETMAKWLLANFHE